MKNPYGIPVSTDWIPPTFEVEASSIPRARRADVDDSRPRDSRQRDFEELARPSARRAEIVENLLPPKAPRFEAEADEPVAPRRAPASYEPRQSSTRMPSGEYLDIFNQGSGWGIFSIFVATVMYEMVNFGWVMVNNGVAADPVRQQNAAVFLLVMGLLGILVSVALVFAKGLSYRQMPHLGAGGVVGYLFAAICAGLVLFGSMSNARRPSGSVRTNPVRTNTVRPGGSQIRSTVPRPPPRTFRPPR